MAVRDKVLPVIDKARAKIASLGLRRYEVRIRRKKWLSGEVGEGDVENTDVVITPAPKVRIDEPFVDQQTGIHGSGGTFEDRTFTISKITPSYVAGLVTGGYNPGELRLVPADRSEEVLVVLTGDDGIARECDLVTANLDRALGYTLKVRLRRRPGT